MTPATILEHDGVKQSVTEWALDYGITPSIIIARHERGMSTADAITLPMKVGHCGQRLPIFSNKQKMKKHCHAAKKAKTYTFEGKTLSVPQWSDLTGLKISTIGARLRKGWTIEQAVTMPLAPRGAPGVPSDFAPSRETGGWGTAQETPNITFSGIDA